MANMSYVRFENTYSDLRDCYEHIEDEEYSEREREFRLRLIKLAAEITCIALDLGELGQDQVDEIAMSVGCEQW